MVEVIVQMGRGVKDLFLDSFSEDGTQFLKDIGIRIPKAGKERRDYWIKAMKDYEIELRTDPRIIEYVKKKRLLSSSFGVKHGIVVVPDGVDWIIESVRGFEWVSEPHKKWTKRIELYK